MSFMISMFVGNNMLIMFSFLSQKNYTSAWDKIKAKGYQIPHDSNALQHAKIQKIVLSNVSSSFSVQLCAITMLEYPSH